MIHYSQIFRAIAELSPFRGPLRVHYFVTLRRAKRWGRSFCRRHPFGMVQIEHRPRKERC